MEILVFDRKDKNDQGLYEIISDNLENADFTYISELDDALYKLREKEFDIIIVDFSTNEGKSLLIKVEELDPAQRVITLSDTLGCSAELGCEYCEKHFRRKRLLKPVDAYELIKYIVNFDELKCKYTKSFENIVTILEDIIKRFGTYRYDKEKHMIVNDTKSPLYIKELIEIVEILNRHYIPYEIINEDIKILQ